MDPSRDGPAGRPPWWRRAWHSRHRRLLARYVTGSAASTLVSQVVLAVLYALGSAVAVASAVAYVAGIPVNYLLQRRWTWGARAGGSRLVGYLVTVGISAVVVVALTTGLEAAITAQGWTRTVEVTLVTVAFLAVNGLVFLAKYVLFDRVVFTDPVTRTGATSAGQADSAGPDAPPQAGDAPSGSSPVAR